MHLHQCCLILFAIMLNWSKAIASDWPQFRGPNGNATAADAKIPTEWSATQNIRWKTALPGRGSSSPIIEGDRVFLTAYSGYGESVEKPGRKKDLKLHVLCFRLSSGELIWDRSTPGSLETQRVTNRVVDHGFATGTPTADGQAVYAFFGVSGVVAYDYDGNKLWQTSVGTGTAGFGSASSPVVFEDLVFVNASIESQTLYALSKSTGEVVWKADSIIRSWTTPCVAAVPGGGYEVVLNQTDQILAFDPKTGEKLWTCEAIDDYVVPVPISHDGVVYCLGGRSNRAVAVKLGGRGDVTETHRLWRVNTGANVTSPVYFDGRIYWASDKAIANCLDAKTGEIVYRERLPTRARIYASIVRAGEWFYITTRDAGVVVAKAEPTFKEHTRNVIETDSGLLNASPAIGDDVMLLRTDSYLYAIGHDSK
ncbi:outer membrane protein assembly factor BamB family protein [Thalassoroseus pseudoceratinae]|uniref:outer membrane protein assembly factor BamB family protein n=1 Tax=Thalassoroseus pseudoceratinae TaxID=2713176 RepID=UPI00141EE548|nr:PQQ-binding-like beta-propeller repeat protein [Thalassoroseus pseudoceratinae]